MKKLIDLAQQRKKLKALETQDNRMSSVWKCVKRFAREQPEANPWLLPFVALIDEWPQDIANAKVAINDYLAGAEKKGARGYLFNIWCFAFPHCRWAIWFDLMRKAGCYTQEEADAIAAKFLMIQFRDNHAGLLIKPFPQCVDNQAASLVLASYVVGGIFADDGPGHGNIARKMRDEAAPRLEAMIGGMPKSGYSGEGSTYQGLIVAFAVPFLTEMLEDLQGKDLFETPLWPNGTSPRKILEMTKRLWMPGGLLLPWDDYGYQFGIRFPLAYLAHRTGDRQCMQMLEHSANWTRMNITSSGWGFDEPIWTLIYWPDYDKITEENSWSPWAEEELGAVLVDPQGENYLMQMWDETAPMCVRSHVNPNSLILVHKGIPFSADGSKTDDCRELKYEGASFERSFGAGAHQVMDLSKGCGGSHNAILVDGYEGLRPENNAGPDGAFEQGRLVSFDEEKQIAVGDNSGIYKSVYADCQAIVRRSQLVENRFWVVEDFAKFANEHEFTSRWWFRPQAEIADGGVDVTTPEGGLLQMRCVQGKDKAEIKRIDGYPKEPDGCSDRVDFRQTGHACRWLYVLWPTTTLETTQVLDSGWKAFPIEGDMDCAGITAFAGETYAVHPGTPPWFQQELPIRSTWAFTSEVSVADHECLQLPRGIDYRSKIWLNGTEYQLPKVENDKLVPHLIDGSEYRKNGKLRISLILSFAVGQADHKAPFSIPDNPFKILEKQQDPEKLKSFEFRNNEILVKTTRGNTYELPYRLIGEGRTAE